MYSSNHASRSSTSVDPESLELVAAISDLLASSDVFAVELVAAAEYVEGGTDFSC